MTTTSTWCNRIIVFSFYALFFTVPLFFTNSTSELFELNKMWITFALTTVIAASWLTKAIIQRQFTLQRTLFDIPLLLFLLSQIISTLISMDQHISFWGYYSRFNGGLLSTICYIILYYAFVTFMTEKKMLYTLGVSLITGVIVALWGFPSHFGKDPTCYLFRGTLDVSCWTDAFRPTVRIFSTLGQPAWLAAYLTILLPLSISFFLMLLSKKKHGYFLSHPRILAGIIFVTTALFYADLVFANTRAGIIAFWFANIIFWGLLLIKHLLSIKKLLVYGLLFNLTFILISFFYGWTIDSPYLPTLANLQARFSPKAPVTDTTTAAKDTPSTPVYEGTDSGKIRLYVWQGAIEAWKSAPLFGTGVETFAFAYYKVKPAGHNMTSEWDYLYNKAHNEYLNYLTTTGIFGLGTYLAFITLFLFVALRWMWSFRKNQQSEQTEPFFTTTQQFYIVLALLGGFLGILITNFFGFSVVIINLYFFLIPAFFLFTTNLLSRKKPFVLPQTVATKKDHIDPYQWTGIIIVFCIAFFFLYKLFIFREADKAYALGHNLAQVNQYTQAYPLLLQAVQTRGSEPTFKDELSLTSAALGAGYLLQKDTTNATPLIQQAISLSDEVVTDSPNNVVFWKDRVRMFYTLSQADGRYLSQALESMQKAHDLAPTDAKIAYNLGVLYGQNGQTQKGVELLQQAITLKPDYKDAYFALGLFYRDLAVDKNNKVIDPAMNQKAIDKMHYILDNFNPNDKPVKDQLKAWGVQ